MQKFEVEFLAAALDDLANLLDYISIEQETPRAALKIVDRVETRCLQIGEWPESVGSDQNLVQA